MALSTWASHSATTPAPPWAPPRVGDVGDPHERGHSGVHAEQEEVVARVDVGHERDEPPAVHLEADAMEVVLVDRSDPEHVARPDGAHERDEEEPVGAVEP